MTTLPIDTVICDPRCQPRQQINEAVVTDYAKAMATGTTFPPVTVFHDETAYWLADGFHRHAAAKEAGRKTIDCTVAPGTLRDAILHAVGANATHGLRRSNDDKRRAVETLLHDPEWAAWSDREIARQCGVTHPFVARMRALSGNDYQMDRVVTRGDSTYRMSRPAPRIRRRWMERLDDDAVILPAMHDLIFQSLKSSIAARGMINPVIVDQDGDIIDGYWRVLAWTHLRAEGMDIEDYPRSVRQFANDQARNELYLDLNLSVMPPTINQRALFAVMLHEDGHAFDDIVDALHITDLAHQRDLKQVFNDLDNAA